MSVTLVLLCVVLCDLGAAIGICSDWVLTKEERRGIKEGMKYEILDSSLRFGIDSESHKAMPVIPGRNGELAPAHLFQVTVTRSRKGRTGITSQYLVIADTPKGAISQVDGNAFPELDMGDAFMRRDELTSSAVRLPFFVRGWGVDTF